MVEPDLIKRNVFPYATVHVKFENIESTSTEDAISKAEDIFLNDADHHLKRGEFSDEITAAMVDVVGDEEYLLSETVELNPPYPGRQSDTELMRTFPAVIKELARRRMILAGIKSLWRR